MKKRFILIIYLFFTIGVPIVLFAGGTNDENEKVAISENLKNYAEFLKNEEFEKWGLLHTEDVIKMPPDAPAMTSREEMVANIINEGKVMKFADFSVSIMETVIHGKYAYAWGNYTVELRPKAGGSPIMVDGKFLTLYKKINGIWLISHDCFNSNVPPSM